MKNVLIVGYGNIGQKLYKEYIKLCPDRYDPYKGYYEKKDIIYDFAFIVVDTPMDKITGECDLSQVKQAVDETSADICILCSTVPVGTTDKLIKDTGKRIIFSPEFFGTTQHCDHSTFDYSYTILGGDKKDCNAVLQLLQEIYDARHRFFMTDTKSAELTKYMANTMLAAKVSLCVQFWKICKQFDIEYPVVRELLLQDCRFNRAHTFVYDEHPYWESHCFDKDLRALVNFADAPLVKSIIEYNEQCKGDTKCCQKTDALCLQVPRIENICYQDA